MGLNSTNVFDINGRGKGTQRRRLPHTPIPAEAKLGVNRELTFQLVLQMGHFNLTRRSLPSGALTRLSL